ncbi:MAG: hypothetical protein ACYC8T_30615 [Myxococcaceae bacterium]
MKIATTLAVGVTLLSASLAQAKCQSDGIRVFPAPGAVIPLNSQMIIEGLGTEQARVSALVGKELVLKAEDDVISVKVTAGWKSTQNRVAVLLKLKSPLRPNKQYALMLDKLLPEYVVLNEDAPETVYWRSGSEADEKAPRYKLKPSISEGIYRTEGDRVTRQLKIHTTLLEESPSYLVVTLRRSRGATGSQTYFIPLEAGEGLLGSDGCTGGFELEDGRAYKATAEAFDSTGRRAGPLPAIELHAPRPVGP